MKKKDNHKFEATCIEGMKNEDLSRGIQNYRDPKRPSCGEGIAKCRLELGGVEKLIKEKVIMEEMKPLPHRIHDNKKVTVGNHHVTKRFC